MVAHQEIKSSLKDLSRYGSGLVGVFVGGTSGIGESTAREFVRYTQSPYVYLVGRSQEAADKLIPEFKSINATSQIEFIKSDVSLLRNVDDVCKQLKAKESKINILYLSPGYLTFQGRNETEEGLDKKFSLHYYARMRFISQLLPLLSAAASSPTEPGKTPLARAISVLHAGIEKKVNLNDFSLKNSFSLARCADHATTGNTLALNVLAATPAAQGVTLIHSAPGGVNTNIAKRTSGIGGYFLRGATVALPYVMPSLIIPVQESGERHLYAATSDKFANGGEVLLDRKSETIEQNATLKAQLAEGVDKKVWEHTEEVFKKICDEGGKY